MKYLSSSFLTIFASFVCEIVIINLAQTFLGHEASHGVMGIGTILGLMIGGYISGHRIFREIDRTIKTTIFMALSPGLFTAALLYYFGWIESPRIFIFAIVSLILPAPFVYIGRKIKPSIGAAERRMAKASIDK